MSTLPGSSFIVVTSSIVYCSLPTLQLISSNSLVTNTGSLVLLKLISVFPSNETSTNPPSTPSVKVTKD